MPGHVFVTHGDLTKLMCDAWLLPCNVGLGVNRGWLKGASSELKERLDALRPGEPPVPPHWGKAGARVIAFEDWGQRTSQPQPYLVNMGGVPGTNVDWYLEGVRQFVQVVATHHANGGWLTGRPKALVGLPLVGTGYGGAHDIKGHVVRALLAELYEAAKAYDVDLVLVTNEVHAFVAAQNARRQYGASVTDGAALGLWHDLDGNLLRSADELASHARRGRLVLFLGAGVSVGAGLPGWEQLLANLAADAEMERAEQAALARLHTLDRAGIIESRLAARGIRLGERIAERFVTNFHSLTHSLLASLPIAEVVTTNYDCLFEGASEAAGRKVAVLPYQSVVDRSRWLLKMHGCITHPEDIVLTRETYLRYAERRAALFGIVQALLITRHMLFVGFSLTDDNFHRIADDVRKAVRSSDDEKKQINHFGTAIFLLRDRLMEELWQNDLHCVSMDNNGKANTADAARRLEIFLDYLLAEATHATSPLLDHAYDGVLTDEERELRGLLRALQSQATSRIRSSPAWEPIAELLRRLGG